MSDHNDTDAPETTDKPEVTEHVFDVHEFIAIILYDMALFVRYPLGVFVVAVVWEHVINHILGVPAFGSIALITALNDSLRSVFTALGLVVAVVSAWLEMTGHFLRWLQSNALFKTANTVALAIYTLMASGFAFVEGYVETVKAQQWNMDVVIAGSMCIIFVLLVVFRSRILYACYTPKSGVIQ